MIGIMEKRILTRREKEIGTCFVTGMSAKQISRQLGISISTVQGYQKIIRNKLEAKNSYQAGFMLGKILEKI